MTNDTDKQALQIRTQLRDSLFSQALVSWGMGLLCLCLCVWLLTGHLTDTSFLVWAAVSACILLVRLPAVLQAYRGQGNTISHPFYLTGLSAGGLMWGLLPLFSTPQLPLTVQVLILIMPMLICLSIVLTLSAWLPAYNAFAWPIIIPYLVILGFNADGAYHSLLPAALLQFGFCLAVACHFNRQSSNTLALKTQNEQLVSNLSVQNADLQQARDEAEAAVMSKDAFLSRMSHELRTPMNGVMGMTQLLHESSLDENQQQWISSLQLSAQRLLELINDLLDATSLAAANIQLNEEPTSLALISGLLQDSYSQAFSDKGLYLRMEVDEQLPAAIMTDRFRMNQMLRKLMDNALKFTEQGGVTFRVEKMPADILVFSVSDTGAGIDKAHLSKVGELFHQVDGSADRQFEGSGLGLSIVGSLARLMNGTLDIQSESGKGTCVGVRIPLKAVRVPMIDDVDTDLLTVPDQSDNPRKRVLVAEDNPVNQMVIETMLEDMGCEITVADDGNAALERLGQHRFDIIFMDCQMPECDGYEATRQARRSGFVIPIIAVTANTLAGDRQKCLDAGMDDYLAKPFTREALETMLNHWV